MHPRRLLAVAALLIAPIAGAVPGMVSSAWAQSPMMGPYPTYPPGGVPVLGADPYAATGPLPGQWWNPGAPLPTFGSIADRLRFRGEYLHWWTEGMDVPALVTTSPAGTPQNQAAILGEAGTSTLFGGGELNGDAVGGLRAQVGFWLNANGAFALEAEYFQLGEQDDSFFASGDGSQILGRPFFDITNGRETAQLISFPNLVSGNVGVASETQLKSFMLNGRVALCPLPPCGPVDGGVPADRVDMLIGYRHIFLDDGLHFSETLDSQVPNTPGTIVIADRFETTNEFHGLQLGAIYQANFRRLWLESLLRVAIGNNTQTVRIGGSTAITENGVTDHFSGGLLTQRTNSGSHQREVFTMIPEVGLTLGIRLTDWLHATAGYSIVYLPAVVRAGEQIDTDVNPDLLAPEANPFSGPLRPRFRFVESDYLAHGLNFGAELRF